MRPTCASFAGTAVLQQRRGRWRAPLLLGLGRSEACRLVFSTANVLDIRVLCGQGRLRQLRSAKLSAKLPRVALEGEAQRVGQRQQTHRLCARPPQPGHLRSGRLRGPSQPGQPLWCAWGFVTVTGGGRQGCWPLLSGAGKKPQTPRQSCARFALLPQWPALNILQEPAGRGGARCKTSSLHPRPPKAPSAPPIASVGALPEPRSRHTWPITALMCRQIHNLLL
eukprot:COSAG06_NODE_6612_length_2855_cov_4.995646_2_plen_224_part_00